MQLPNQTGYKSPVYARALEEYGQPHLLPHSKGWILKRAIPHTAYSDAMGCYPIFACNEWPALPDDLSHIGEDIVALSIVTDPFGAYDEKLLSLCFPNLMQPFKAHFVIDLDQSPQEHISKHHRRNINKALKTVNVELCARPLQFLNQWTTLYQNLIERHNITGISAFSRRSFATQLTVPGTIMFQAIEQNQTVGMIIWYIQGDIAYYHLAAYTSQGYRANASYALFWHSIEYFSSHHPNIQWLSLGAGAGLNVSGKDGLTRFKNGWATGIKTAYLCGRIFQPKLYQDILHKRDIAPTTYFPAYRQGEFG